MNLPEQISRPSAHHDSWPPLPRVGQQSKRESRLSSASSTNASASRRQWDRAQRPRHAPHPQIMSSRNRLVRPLPIAAETLDSGWRLSQSHTLPSISRVVPQSCPPLRLRHESTPFGLSSAQQCRIAPATPSPPRQESWRRGHGQSILFERRFCLLHHDVFRVSAVTMSGDIRAGIDFIALLKFGDAGTHYFDNPGNVPARNKWQGKGNVILHVACSDFPVDGIHRSSMDSYQQFTRTGRRAGGIFEPEHFRPAIVVDSHSFHVFHFAISLGKTL